MLQISSGDNIVKYLDQNVKSIVATIMYVTHNTPYEDLRLIGGTIRDTILETGTIKDLDFVTEHPIEPLIQLIENALPKTMFKIQSKYGTCAAKIKGINVEIVRARSESYSPGSRKPDVKSGTFMDDIMRRDFTINTLCMNLQDGILIDPTGFGLTHLYSNVIKTCSDPDSTFFDDPLRMLRAIRFSIRFKSTITFDDFLSIKRNACRLTAISKERIADELVKMFSVSPADALRQLYDTNLLRYTPLSPLCDSVGVKQPHYHIYDVWKHMLRTVHYLRGCNMEVIFSAILHDVAKPYVEKDGHFYDHHIVGARLAYEICSQLRFDKKFCENISNYVLFHMRRPNDQWSMSAYRRLYKDIIDAGITPEILFTLMEADYKASNTEVLPVFKLGKEFSKIHKSLEFTDNTIKSPLTGDDIINILHIKPGPMIKYIKNTLIDKVISGELTSNSRDKAISMLDDIVLEYKESADK